MVQGAKRMTQMTAFPVSPEVLKFVRSVFRACDKRLGLRTEQEDTDFMDSLFRRRSGPISAASAIAIDKSDAH